MQHRVNAEHRGPFRCDSIPATSVVAQADSKRGRTRTQVHASSIAPAMRLAPSMSAVKFSSGTLDK